MSSALNFHLEQYEGPLDLLLDLIRKQQVNIYDIPIAKITAQYLEYMQKAMELDIELSSDFVYMAATLIHIKSKMLLPRDPELEKISPEEDPRQELVERLIEHERFKNAAEMLQQKRMVEEASGRIHRLSSFSRRAKARAWPPRFTIWFEDSKRFSTGPRAVPPMKSAGKTSACPR